MRVSDSVPSEVTRRLTALRAAPYAIALAYLGAHLPFLAPSLEDIDSINFALGLHHFDPALHQPHPPGYPVYIAIGRVTLAILHAVAPSIDATRADALALAIWSALGGAIALVAAASLFRSIGARYGHAVSIWGIVLLCAAPLFWMCGLRPMSDMPGLAAALAAQALLVRGTSDRRALAAGALAAGLAAGIRSQTVWLTGPLLVFAMVAQRRGGWRRLWAPVAALAAGVVAWAVPLIVASGGIRAYLMALGSQAGEDLAWVDMLWAHPTPRRIAFALYETFVLPWDSPRLAAVMGAAVIAGAVVMLLRDRRALGLICIAFVPYAVFHLLLQETVTVRYALPLLPAMAYASAYAVCSLRRYAPVAGVPLVIAGLLAGVPAATAYAREPHPAFRAIADMARAAATDRPGAVYAHYALRRPLQTQAAASLPVVEPPRTYEWLGPVDYWLKGGSGPVWFLADPKRTDLELIDPMARRAMRRYPWEGAAEGTLSGMRPTGADWYRLQDPGWFVTEGWSLTPETGGIAVATRKRIDARPIEGYIRRRGDAALMVIGGRHLGTAADSPVSFEAAIDGRIVDTWTADPATGIDYLRLVELSAHALDGSGPYARLTITAHPARQGAAMPPVAVEQFDVQPATGLVHAFGNGWYEYEYDNATGRTWRWTSQHAELRVAPAKTIRLTLRGESPVKYFRAVPKVDVRAGGRVVAELRPSDDFTWQVTVPGADVARSHGIVAIDTDRVYLPGPAEGTSDARRLGLRLFDVRVDTVFP